MTLPPGEPFSAVLRQASVQDHADAESNGYMSDLMGGKLPLSAYTALTARLLPVYAALEEAAEAMREHPVAGRFVFAELVRRPALEADLAELLGPDWAGRIGESPAAHAYAARIREVAFTSPGGFLAHHYVRYMGDLSGGQIIGRRVERVYGLEGGRGTGFYRFDGLKTKPFKEAYRRRVDEAPFDAGERGRIIDEVRLAYRLNTAVFDELGAVDWSRAA
ncbi:biliverdin-producing heme oxygenase [Actinocorallia populi]|uniref:biliverdin-producing heme oxygenase n=1 Tax=Actinocorallia populi TaxID=2079200 RepID=UPI000D097910|nr:biliverdin-producing heme oxygenase [Actinocorallia populi]